MNRPVNIFVLTKEGNKLAQRLLAHLPSAEIFVKPKPFSVAVQRAFKAGHGLIMICASGIAIRSLASVINNKHEDPPVLLLDERGQFVIPLLSGHEGGANDWGQEVASFLGSQLVLTTASAYVQPIYTIGMGCERHCTEEKLRQLLDKCLAELGISMEQVHSINSIDIKSDELGLMELSKSISKPFYTYDKKTLGEVEHLLSTKSDYVFSVVGVYGVAESAALVAAKCRGVTSAELVLTKRKSKTATCAIARSYLK